MIYKGTRNKVSHKPTLDKVSTLKTIKQRHYTSIDPKQLQNDSFRPILVKKCFLGTPHRVQGRGQDKDKRRTRPGHTAQPQRRRTRRGQEEDKAQPQSPAREDKRRTRPGHRAQPQKTRGGQGLPSHRGQKEDKTRTHSPVTEEEDKKRTRGGQGPATEDGLDTEPSHRGQEEDKAWTRSPATEDTEQSPATEDKAWTQSPATEFRGAASECGQLFFSKIEPQQ